MVVNVACSINGIHPTPRKVMQLLRLRQINNGTFVKLNKATLQMLRLADPYITWGYPNMKSVRELIYKRGYGKIDGRRIPLTDNSVIESKLGKLRVTWMIFIESVVVISGRFVSLVLTGPGLVITTFSSSWWVRNFLWVDWNPLLGSDWDADGPKATMK